MPSLSFSIRQARAGDLEVMVTLLRQLFTMETDFKVDTNRQRHGLAALLADHDRSVIFVAACGETIVGMCTAQITISTAEGGMNALVEDMVVDKNFRARGVGTALLHTITQWAKEHGCLRMQLVADKRNDNALRFYHRNGWNLTNMICLTRMMPAMQRNYSACHRSRTTTSGGAVHA